MPSKKSIQLIDISDSTDNCRSLKEFNKISKYKDPEKEIEKVGHLKTTSVPVIMVAFGMMKNYKEKHYYDT